MAKILCGISGIEFTCEHLPIYLSSREYAHPVFFMPQKKLLGLYQKYRHAELGSTDAWLLFLAYLNSTDLVEWRVPAKRSAQSDSIVANNFEQLVNLIERINRVRNPRVQFAKLCVTPDTCTLDNIKYWLASWEATFDSYLRGNKQEQLKQDLAALESTLEYLVKDANRNEVQFASRLAEWADKAGGFPRFPVQLAKTVTPCNEYWKQIIRKCTNQESIFAIPAKDLAELIEHCEENIEAGSIYAHHLFKILKEGRNKQQSFLGLGDFSFTILTGKESVEEANKLAIINNAPDEEPNRLQYPSQFQYLKAKLAWDMKVRNAANTTNQKVTASTVSVASTVPVQNNLSESDQEYIRTEILGQMGTDDTEDTEDNEELEDTEVDIEDETSESVALDTFGGEE